VPLAKLSGKPRPVVLGQLLVNMPIACAVAASESATERYLALRPDAVKQSRLSRHLSVGAGWGADLMSTQAQVFLIAALPERTLNFISRIPSMSLAARTCFKPSGMALLSWKDHLLSS